MAATVRISEAAHRALSELAERENVPMQTVLDRAIENYRRLRFLEAANRQYAALRANPVAWAQEEAERELWDRTLTDQND